MSFEVIFIFIFIFIFILVLLSGQEKEEIWWKLEQKSW
jgi:hypothetical protein